jgi:putative tryptophan/tyrosine transport system substrate-binding protein
MRPRAALLAVIALGALVVGAPPIATPQQPAKVFRIGVLSPAEQTSTKIFDAFREGLRGLGYIDGQNIIIEYRLAAGDYSRLPTLVVELVRIPVDVIVTDGQISTLVTHDATRTIPIVGGVGDDPVAAGLAKSFAHPSGNVTGFSPFGAELKAKRLQLLKEAIPAISRIAVLWNPAEGSSELRSTEEAARTLGVQLRPVEVATPEEIAAGFEAVEASGAEAVVIAPVGMFWNQRARIVALAAKHRMPAIYPEREYVDDGGLLAYGRNVPDLWRSVLAGYVDKILKGAKPGDLPIQQPTKFELVVNLKTAATLGLTIPPSILARADEVIE